MSSNIFPFTMVTLPNYFFRLSFLCWRLCLSIVSLTYEFEDKLGISEFKPVVERVISHQNPVNPWEVKALMSPYILCKIANFESAIAQRWSGILPSNCQRWLAMLYSLNVQHWFFGWWIRERWVYANDPKKDSPVVSKQTSAACIVSFEVD